jgi:hypothetical protein
VTAVERNSVADREDIRQGDLIQAVNRQTVQKRRLNSPLSSIKQTRLHHPFAHQTRLEQPLRALRVPKTE